MSKDGKSERKIQVTFSFENLGVESETIHIGGDLSAQPNAGTDQILQEENLVVDFSKLRVFGEERRANPRVIYWGPVTLHGKETKVSVATAAIDLNLKGIGLAVDPGKIAVGSEYTAEFNGSGSMKPFSVDCVAVRIVEGKGKSTVGLQVTRLGKLAEANIKAYLDSYDATETYIKK